ncbi:hypothetical protein CLLI_02750 [Clostridium liquoris]|uniref:Uncharacterized protein n=1 Tax=Clostridium liquoris TaxID=1289519 RepID=A0A2T0BA36_9CLOT|nr:hypothetical protein CLLI_02750 [Clostridium liquoris]
MLIWIEKHYEFNLLYDKKAFRHTILKSRRLVIKFNIALNYAAMLFRHGKISEIDTGFSEAQASIKQLNAPRNTLIILRSAE